MDFGKDDIAPTRNIQMLPESGSASILSQESISINENNVGTNVMTLGLPVSNFYQEGVVLQTSDESNHNKASTSMSMPLYLLTTTTDDEQNSLTSTSDLQLHQSAMESEIKRIENFAGTIAVPITYYSPVSTNQPQIISFINKPTNNPTTSYNKAVLSEREKQLSEDFVRSFVVGGDRKSKSVFKVTESCEDAAPKSFSPTSENRVSVLIKSTGGIDCSVQTADCDNHSSNESTQNGIASVAPDSSVVAKGILKAVNSKASQHGGILAEQFSAEELLRSQLDLHMDCTVEAETADFSGVTLAREVATQTLPVRAQNSSKNKKQKKTREPILQPAITPEIKVILTTDDPDVEMDSSNSDISGYFQAEANEYQCSKCTLSFAERDVLEVHIRCHSENVHDERYVCYICGLKHNQWIKMYNHLFSHGLKKPYHCDQCTYSCSAKSDLINHSYVHSDEKVWVCPKCERPFKHQRNMKAHSRNCLGVDQFGKSIRANSEGFECNICHKRLINKRNLEKHMEIHTDLKPFVCNICGHRTRLKESLLTHKRVHTGEKPFKCDVCSYSTADKSALRRHKRKHTNEKPYACKYCDYKSIQKHCLDTHIHRKHTGEKFICGLCHYETFHRYALNQHFKQQHREEMEQSAGTEETCLVSVAPAVVISNTNHENPSSGSSMFIGIPSSTASPTLTNDKPIDVVSVDNLSVVSTSDVLNNRPEPNISSSASNVETVTAQSSIDVMQQIQQSGDVVYLQQNGNILIKKQDMNVLIIQQVEEDAETSAAMT